MSIATIVAGSPLRVGSTNVIAVKAVQSALHVSADGDFGEETRKAVTAFQQQHGLGADGVVGPITARALDAVAGGAVPASAGKIQVAARSDFGAAPIWFQWALHELGVHEVGNNSGSDIRRYIDDAHVGHEGWPWCAEFVNAALEVNGVPGTRSASSQSFLNHPNFVRLSGPALGAITVFGHGQGLGHVTFYRGETADRIFCLGGNQSDSVSVAGFPRKGTSMWFEAYCWPKGVPLPVIAAIPIRAGEPLAQIKVV